MMNGPYYRNYSRSIPVHQPKVVSIPVHFISSDHQPQTYTISTLKHSSALKIQKVFKGHTVRKSVKKIVSIRNHVNEIEKRLQNDVVFVNLLRNDAKERLRVNETLMSLLLQLDSVRGVENGVREVRKSVAKKAVALQEKLDSIAQTFDDDVIIDEKTEFCDVSDSARNKVHEDDDVSRNDQNSASVEDQELVVKNDAMNEDSMKECDDDVSNVENHVIDEGSMKDCGGGGDDDVRKRCCDKRVVEKLMCDNAKMMKLMIEISERNEMQTGMINSLSKRVEHLEKAFIMSDNKSLRRRRKKSYTRREKHSFCI